MATSIVISLLFFLPLLIFPVGLSWFEPPKVIVAQILIEILTVTYLFKRKINISKKVLVPIVLLILLTIIHIIFFRTQTTFFGNSFRLQGIFLLWHLLLFAFISSQIKLPKIPFFVYLIPLLGLVASSFYFGKNEIGRSLGSLGEPNALAATAIFLFPFLVFSKSNKIIKAMCAGLVLWLVIVSGSRAGLIALGLQILFLVLSKYISLKRAVLICLLTLTLTLTFPFIESGGWYENRSEVWQAALAAGYLNPIFGGGFGNIEKLLPKGSQIVNNNAQYQYVDSSHNFLLDYWVSGGLIGISLMLFLLFKTIKNFIFEKKRLEITAFLGLITVMSFNPVSVVTLVVFWWLIGQGLTSTAQDH